MKNLSFYLIIILFYVTTTLNAQEGFSAKAGLNNVSISLDVDEFGSVSTSNLGFFLGGGYNLELNENFDLEPSILLSFVNELTSLYIPIMAKYKITETFNIQAGPQINYLLEDVPDGALGVDLAFGGGYNFTENWFIEARYGFELMRGGDYGEAVNINTLTIGTGYRF